MKKIFLIGCVAMATLFTACNSSTKEATPAPEAAETEVVEEKVEAAETSALDQYAELVEKVIELGEKAKQGDTEAIQELTKISQEAQALVVKIQEELPTMTDEQKARFDELAQKALDMMK